MRPIDFPERNIKIAEKQDEYQTLPAHIQPNGIDGSIISFCWGLNFWERLALLFRGRVWHQVLVWGPLQPQLLSIDKPNMDDPLDEGSKLRAYRYGSHPKENVCAQAAISLTIDLLSLREAIERGEPKAELLSRCDEALAEADAINERGRP